MKTYIVFLLFFGFLFFTALGHDGYSLSYKFECLFFCSSYSVLLMVFEMKWEELENAEKEDTKGEVEII